MSATGHPAATGCPGCAALPPVPRDAAAGAVRTDLALPGIHCAVCIATVERGLMARPDVRSARVNLSERRVRLTSDRPLPMAALVADLAALGIHAAPLDGDLLSPRDVASQRLLTRIAVAGFAMMNVMLLSVAIWSGATDATRDLFHWISAAISLPALAYAAQPFAVNAWAALHAGRLNMDVPISVAIVLSAAMSLWETGQGGEHAFFDAALSLTFFLLIGRYLDHRSRGAAQSAAARLSALEVPSALRLRDGQRQTVPLSALIPGDTVVVLPGARVPADGTILDGASDIDRSVMTGESLAVPSAPGDRLSAGEINGAGCLTMRVTATGEDTALRRMITMIDAAEGVRNRYTALADRAAAIYAPAVHLLALAAFIGWVAIDGDIRHALNIAIAVLIITCPCALGLAVPAVSTAAAGHLFRHGLLVKSGTALERIARVDTVVFDKTGTLTDGLLRPGTGAGLTHGQRGLAVALAEASGHPVARAIAAGLGPEVQDRPALTDLRDLPGRGVEGLLDGRRVRLGAADWIGPPVDAADGTRAHPALLGAWLDGPDGVVFLPLTATLRPGAAAAVSGLRALGLGVHLLSGDTAGATADIADRLGFDSAVSGAGPADKVARLEELARAGRHVLMIGDGLNDTGALSAAWASVSPASAADAARAASDVVILGGDFSVLTRLVRTAGRARRRAVENFGIAAAYNLVAIPVALTGHATPLVAAIAMSASSITVLLNALRVRG